MRDKYFLLNISYSSSSLVVMGKNRELKKIVSISGLDIFIEDMKILKREIEKNLGYKVILPIRRDIDKEYNKLTYAQKIEIESYFVSIVLGRIEKSDALLVANYQYNGTANYVSPTSFMEMCFAYSLNKKIFLLDFYPNPPNIAEVLGMDPIVLSGNTDLIGSYIND